MAALSARQDQGRGSRTLPPASRMLGVQRKCPLETLFHVKTRRQLLHQA